MITSDFNVYETLYNFIDEERNELYLSEKPMPLKQKYPKLYYNEAFENTMKYFFNAFFLRDKETVWLCMTTLVNNKSIHGINFDVENKKIFDGFFFQDTSNTTILSTNLNENVYFAVKQTFYNGEFIVQLARFQLSDNNSIPVNNLVQAAKLNQIDGFKTICLFDDHHLIIHSNQLIKCGRKPFTIQRGFTTNKRFYLFGTDEVYIFDSKLFFTFDKPFPLIKKDYAKFIICNRSENSKMDELIFLMLLMKLMTLILLTITVILCCCFLCCKNKKTEKKKRHRHKLRKKLTKTKLSSDLKLNEFNKSLMQSNFIESKDLPAKIENDKIESVIYPSNNN